MIVFSLWDNTFSVGNKTQLHTPNMNFNPSLPQYYQSLAPFLNSTIQKLTARKPKSTLLGRAQHTLSQP